MYVHVMCGLTSSKTTDSEAKLLAVGNIRNVQGKFGTEIQGKSGTNFEAKFRSL